jgi:hypothetical protein
MKAVHFSLVLAATLLAMLSSSALAQHVHIGVSKTSHGHHHGHHHHHYSHPSWNFSYGVGYDWGYYPPPVTYIYAPPPRPQVTYVVPPPTTTILQGQASLAPQTMTAARANALPAAATGTATIGTVVIANPTGSGGPVTFIVDENSEVNLQPGESRTLAHRSSYIIEYDRGGDFGIARRTLGQGTFQFVATERGWDLMSPSDVQSASRPSVKRNSLPSPQRR